MYITVRPVTTTETATQNSIENPAPVTLTGQTRVKSYGSNLRVLSISESSDFQSNTKSENGYRHGILPQLFWRATSVSVIIVVCYPL